MSVSGVSNTITVVFNKRLDAASAVELTNYTVQPGNLVSAKVDGNLVKLDVTGRATAVTVRNLADDSARRLFKNHSAAMMTDLCNRAGTEACAALNRSLSFPSRFRSPWSPRLSSDRI